MREHEASAAELMDAECVARDEYPTIPTRWGPRSTTRVGANAAGVKVVVTHFESPEQFLKGFTGLNEFLCVEWAHEGFGSFQWDWWIFVRA